jgi:hypothetical protein
LVVTTEPIERALRSRGAAGAGRAMDIEVENFHGRSVG